MVARGFKGGFVFVVRNPNIKGILVLLHQVLVRIIIKLKWWL